MAARVRLDGDLNKRGDGEISDAWEINMAKEKMVITWYGNWPGSAS